MNVEFLETLRSHTTCEVRSDPLMRKIYSVDASIFEVEPAAIAIPRSQADLISAIKIAHRHLIPITARGAATGITGGCLGNGLIIDTAQHLNTILEIRIEGGYAVCEPGVVQDRLNEALAPEGFRLGPDTSTGNRATLAGMAANNAAGSRSLIYGTMVDSVISVKLVLANGDTITTEPLDEAAWNKKLLQNDQEGHIYREIDAIRNTHRAAIDAHFPKIPRHVSGYNLDALIGDFPLNISRLIVGSEGTLGIIAEIKVAIAKRPKHTGLCVIHVADMIESVQFVESMLSHHPSALELIDEKIINAAKNSPALKSKLNFIQGEPQALFVAEFIGDTPEEVSAKLNTFSSDMKRLNLGYAHPLIQNVQEEGYVWEIRKAGLGLLLSKRSYSRAIAFIEDLSVPPKNLSPFLKEFAEYLKSVDKEAGIYGHIGSGCMHIRPYIDLRDPSEITLITTIMEKIAAMVHKYGGAMSGEHGDGLIRSWLNERMFGDEIYQAFKRLKNAFDPKNLMNPNKIVNGNPPTNNLRLNAEIPIVPIATFLDFTGEGGFELAADLCNGNAQCRKAESVMCPSFQATNDEYQTTRARAQSLRSVIHGRTPINDFTNHEMYDVMDLCIECKGCKRECPSQVDMAKMKSEFLFQYQERHGYFLRNRFFGLLNTAYRMIAPFAWLVNTLQKGSFSKYLLSRIGITPNRTLPELSSERFSGWFEKQQQPKFNKNVILFNDTYTEFNQPEIGRATFKILMSLGYNVTLAKEFCCGRPSISKGLLRQAQSNAARVVTGLHDLLEKETRIIVLEPSCLSAFRDDYKGLLGKDESLNQKREAVAAACISLDEFLAENIVEGRLPIKFREGVNSYLVHGHCHQKALVGMNPTLQVLRAIPGAKVEEIASGCCGMAGSFGYESEHYEMSMRIGELHLLPAVRSAGASTVVVASGTSCRSQVTHGTDHLPLHLAEAIAKAMN